MVIDELGQLVVVVGSARNRGRRRAPAAPLALQRQRLQTAAALTGERQRPVP